MSLWSFCLIEYVHNGPFNEPAGFGISGLIFQVKVGTNVGLNMLINLRSGFVITKNFFVRLFFLKIGKKFI